MIYTLAGRKVYVGITSSTRPENVATHPVKATWHVPADKMELYRSVGAPAVALGSSVRAGHAANTVLDAGHGMGIDALIIEDDPVNLKYATPEGKAVPMDPMEALDMLVRLTIENRASMGITAKEFNAYWKKGGPEVSRHGHVAGWVVYVPFGPAWRLRHDETLEYGGQDFDFAVQHLAYGLGFVRCEKIMWKFKDTNPGGFTHRMGEEGRRIMDQQMLDRWGPTGLVRTNPRTGWIHIPRQ